MSSSPRTEGRALPSDAVVLMAGRAVWKKSHALFGNPPVSSSSCKRSAQEWEQSFTHTHTQKEQKYVSHGKESFLELSKNMYLDRSGDFCHITALPIKFLL